MSTRTVTRERNGHRNGNGRNGESLKRDKIDRLPPHSLEIEQRVLGCIFLNPAENLPIVIAKIGGTSDAFYDTRHKSLYETMIDMMNDADPIEPVTVQQRLKDQHVLDAIGGGAYLSSLPDLAGGPVDHYLEILSEKFILRKLIQTCTDVVGRVYEHEGEVDGLLDQCESEVLAIRQRSIRNETPDIKTLVRTALANIEAMYAGQGKLVGIPTGFTDLDRLTSGLQNGELTIIAARPAIGKTSMLMNVSEHTCLDQKLPVGLFSLEMTGAAIVQRMLSSRARVNLRNVSAGFLAERDLVKLTSVSTSLSKAPIYLDDTGGLSILELRARARRMVQQHGVKVIGVDYLQQMNSTNRRAQNREQEIADIAEGCKAMAKELNIPVIVLSQLNRDLERQKNRKPILSDLRESGSLEQAADVVILLYRTGDEDAQEQDGVSVNADVAKNRNGPTGIVHLTFLKHITRFESAAKISAADVPQTNLPYNDQ